MNTYSVTYTMNPNDGTTSTVTVTGKEFLFEGGFVVFIDDTGKAVFAVPVERQPVIVMTAAAA